jgi:hypothetical protein
MRPALLAAAGVCLLAFAFAGGAVRGTASDFTAALTNSGNSVAAAANAAPDVTAAVIGKSAGGGVGFLKRSATFYVYANATDDFSVSSVRATLTNITGSSSAVTLTAGSYTAGSISYGYRSAVLTASSSFSGTKSFTVTATDAGGLTDTFTGSVTLDTTAPTARSIATTNHTGGVDGRAEQGDTAVVTFSETIDPNSIVDGWDGAGRDVQAAIVDGGGTTNDVLRVYAESAAFDPAASLPVGTIDLGRWDFVTSGAYAVFGLTSVNGTASTLTLADKTLTITLGPLDLGASSTTTSNETERYTPVATLTDLAGNAASTTGVTASGGAHKTF